MDNMYIWHIEAAPYICTVPAGGLRDIKCYPDAITMFVNGKKIGYSRKEHTMIIPIGSSGSEIKTYMTEVLKFLKAIDKDERYFIQHVIRAPKEILLEHLRQQEQTGKVVLCAVSKEKQK